MNKAKFTILLLVVALFSGLTAQAQFKIGPKLGVNIDKMDVSGIDMSEDNRCGFTGGLTAEFTVPVLGVGGDISLMYTRMNTELNGERVGSDFLEIPLHAKYKIGIPAVATIIKPYIFTGPTVAFKFGHGDMDTKKTQWGWDLGLGVELINHLQIGAGYTFGMNTVAKYVIDNFVQENGVVVDKSIKVKNNYWTVTAAWLF